MSFRGPLRKSPVIVALAMPLLLGACESFNWEKDNMLRLQSMADQTLSEAKTASGKVDAINEKVSRMQTRGM